MVVKVKQDMCGLAVTSEYEVIGIVMSLKDNQAVVEGTYYYVFNDTYNTINYYDEDNFIILDGTLANDLILVKDEELKSIFIFPQDISYGPFFYALEEAESVSLTKEIYKRFSHVIPEKIYAKKFHNEYQDKTLNETAEGIGDGWVLCSACNDAFEVDQKDGIVKCTSCYTKQNNPYARKI